MYITLTPGVRHYLCTHSGPTVHNLLPCLFLCLQATVGLLVALFAFHFPITTKSYRT